MSRRSYNDTRRFDADRTQIRRRPVAASPEPYAAPVRERVVVRERVEKVKVKRVRAPRHGCLSLFLWIFALCIAVLCAARMLPLDMSVGPLIPKAVSFVPWVIVPAIVILLLALLWARHVLIFFIGMFVALLVWWHAGYFVPSGTLTEAGEGVGQASAFVGDNVVRVMTLNTLNGHADANEVVACVRQNNVEVLALQEVSWSFLEQLAAAGIYDILPYHVESEAGQWDNGGLNCLFSMTPMDNVNSNLLPMELSAISAGTIEVGGRSLRLVSCHPSSPHLGGEGLWDEGLTTIGSLAGYANCYVILGDFNATWNHARFRELLGTTFVDASEQAGEGFHMTWPSESVTAGLRLPFVGSVPPLIEIDHIVYSANSGVFVGDLKTVQIAGTDHLALIGTLEVQ
ncbi:MAG: endonuclease/exonuclease/phosphatase family protein [Atopobiaceae bacterium]|nr:endonuclease/exonuclease/phosphatase family protein [Atopobiaceae bacterium]